MIIDLGCGTAKVPGAIGVDNVALSGVDLVHSLLDFPYPFSDESADTIYLNHVIEHFELVDTQRILAECHRILQAGGKLYIRVPHVFCIAAWIDVTHRRSFAFDSATFWDSRSAKSYYAETDNTWHLTETVARITWLNWKRYRLRKLDQWLSKGLEILANYLLKLKNWPGAADLFVKAVPIFFVEIGWCLTKPE